MFTPGKDGEAFAHVGHVLRVGVLFKLLHLGIGSEADKCHDCTKNDFGYDGFHIILMLLVVCSKSFPYGR